MLSVRSEPVVIPGATAIVELHHQMVYLGLDLDERLDLVVQDVAEQPEPSDVRECRLGRPVVVLHEPAEPTNQTLVGGVRRKDRSLNGVELRLVSERCAPISRMRRSMGYLNRNYKTTFPA